MAANNTKTSFLKSIKGAYANYLIDKFNKKINNCVNKLKEEKFKSAQIGDCTFRMHIGTSTDLKKTFTKKGFCSDEWHSKKYECMWVNYHDVEEIKNKIKYPETGEPYVEYSTIEDGCVEVEFKIEYYYGLRFCGKIQYDFALVYFAIRADYEKTIDESDGYKPKTYVLKDAFGNEIHERDEIIYTRMNFVNLHHDIITKIDGTIVYLSDNSKLFLNEDMFNGNICVINSKMSWSGMKL